MQEKKNIMIGIDYGTRRVGVAVSDDCARLAFPERVVPQSPMLADVIVEMCATRGATTLVVGESLTLKGERNSVQDDIDRFVADVSSRMDIPVILEREYWTSQEVRRTQGMTETNDASAAALILQRYLDKHTEQVRHLHEE